MQEYKEEIYNTIKKTIYFNKVKKFDYDDIGFSKIGGHPDVPKNFKWPKTKDGKLMTFIAQLNLEKISTNDERNLFPRTGMLYFFMGIIDSALSIEHKVIYINKIDDLELLKPKNKTVLEEEFEQSFESYIIEGENSIEIPNYAYEASCIESEIEDYICLEEDFRCNTQNKNYIAKIYGYPEGQHDDVELEAALKIIANHKYRYNSKDKKILVKALNGDENKANNEIKDIVMLLEIDSDDDIGFTWSDCGVIHFFIRKEDLENCNFDNTYLSLYSS